MRLTVTQNINKLNLQATQNNTVVKLQPIVNTSSSNFTETDPIFQASEASLFVAGDKANLDNQSGINTGDETTLSIRTKRPLKTINGESLEGSGNVQIDYNDLDNLPTIPIPITNHSGLNLDDGTNPHGTTKSDVGLRNVDNTSDVDKPISTATQQALDLKVDKIAGKQLSTEDYTTNEKNKLAGIQSGAEVNVNADWNATSGDSLILNKPTIPSIEGLATEIYVDNGLATKQDKPTYVIKNNVSGTHPIDFNVDTHRLTLIGNTTFTEINLPASSFTKTITLHVSGNFGIVLPASWTTFISGSYNGTATLNTIVIETIGNERKVQISQPN